MKQTNQPPQNSRTTKEKPKSKTITTYFLELFSFLPASVTLFSTIHFCPRTAGLLSTVFIAEPDFVLKPQFELTLQTAPSRAVRRAVQIVHSLDFLSQLLFTTLITILLKLHKSQIQLSIPTVLSHIPSIIRKAIWYH